MFCCGCGRKATVFMGLSSPHHPTRPHSCWAMYRAAAPSCGGCGAALSPFERREYESSCIVCHLEAQQAVVQSTLEKARGVRQRAQAAKPVSCSTPRRRVPVSVIDELHSIVPLKEYLVDVSEAWPTVQDRIIKALLAANGHAPNLVCARIASSSLYLNGAPVLKSSDIYKAFKQTTVQLTLVPRSTRGPQQVRSARWLSRVQCASLSLVRVSHFCSEFSIDFFDMHFVGVKR